MYTKPWGMWQTFLKAHNLKMGSWLYFKSVINSKQWWVLWLTGAYSFVISVPSYKKIDLLSLFAAQWHLWNRNYCYSCFTHCTMFIQGYFYGVKFCSYQFLLHFILTQVMPFSYISKCIYFLKRMCWVYKWVTEVCWCAWPVDHVLIDFPLEVISCVTTSKVSGMWSSALKKTLKSVHWTQLT